MGTAIVHDRDIRRRHAVSRLRLVALLIVSAASCKKDEELRGPKRSPAPAKDDDGPVCDELATRLGGEVAPILTSVTPPANTEQSLKEEGVTYTCSWERKTLKQQGNDIILLDGMQDLFVPGNVVSVEGLRGGKIEEIRLPHRASIEISLSVPTLQSAEFTRIVSDASPSAVRQTIQELQALADEKKLKRPFSVSYEIAAATTLEDASATLGITTGFHLPYVDVGFQRASSSTRSEATDIVVVRASFPAFEVHFNEDRLPTLRDFIGAAPEAPTACGDANQAIGDQTPAIVTSVVYGRTLMFAFTSTKTKNGAELEARTRAALGTPDVSATRTEGSTSNFESFLRDSSLIVVNRGGSAADLKAALENGLSVAATAATEVKFSEAKPIGARIKTLGTRRPIDLRWDEVGVRVCKPSDCPEAPKDVATALDINPKAPFDFGGSDDIVYGGPCAGGYVRESNSATRQEGKGHCEPKDGGWVSDDPTDCRVRVHHGATFWEGSHHCSIRVTQFKYREHPNPRCR